MTGLRLTNKDYYNLLKSEIPHLRRYARFLTGDIDQADDLVQDCLLRALDKQHLFNPETKIRPWLFTMMKHIFIGHKRKQAKMMMQTDGEEIESLPESTDQRQDMRLILRDVQRAFNKLDNDFREALMLVAVQGLSYAETAQVAEIPIGTVRSRVNRARQKLLELMESD